jgi:EKC/KEOPS complex subunit CGI121/TPRKB
METWNYAALNAIIHVALFDNVRNAKMLRSRLVTASTMSGAAGDIEREAVNFAFIEAPLVRDFVLHQNGVRAHMLLT